MFLLAGCGSDPAAPPIPPTPQIGGTLHTIHWATDGGSASAPVSPDDVYITAEIADDDVRTATIGDDGRFAIDGDVPAAPYWLRYVDGRHSREDVYVLTDATDVDLGADVVGRDHGVATSFATKVAVDAPGLSTWQDGDDGDMVIAGLGYYSVLDAFNAFGTPADGDTALATSFVWQSLPLSATAAGDAATFTQVRPAHDDALALDYVAPIKVFQADPFAIADAATASVGGSFADPEPLDVHVAWARSQFAAQATAMHPASCSDAPGGETYWVHAVPFAGAHGPIASTLDLEVGARVIDSVATDGTDDLVGTLHVGNPYPADWLHAKYELVFELDCPLPDGTPGTTEVAIGEITNDLVSDVAPLVGPVGDVHVGGRNVSWTAPAIGAATSYELHVLQVGPSPLFGGVVLQELAELIVPGDVTSITVPHDVLVPGVQYAIRIRSVARAAQSTRTAPFRAGIPYAYADLLTPYVQP